MRYIAFDVETPNACNDRMSAIGVSVVEDGEIIKELYTLVNPETYFNSFNIALTGITPQAVADKPTFPQLWPLLEPIFDSGVLIAHNAPFDMRVLASCLRHYQISWKKTADYACTCSMGRRCFPELPNHKLNTLCEHLHIPLDHHNAASDATACAKLLLCYTARGADPKLFTRQYFF